MPISGVILDVKPGSESEVAAALVTIPGVEIVQRGARVLIVTTDTPTIDADRALTERLRDVPGVAAASVAFTNMEDCLDAGGEPGRP